MLTWPRWHAECGVGAPSRWNLPIFHSHRTLHQLSLPTPRSPKTIPTHPLVHWAKTRNAGRLAPLNIVLPRFSRVSLRLRKTRRQRSELCGHRQSKTHRLSPGRCPIMVNNFIDPVAVVTPRGLRRHRRSDDEGRTARALMLPPLLAAPFA